MKYYLLTLKNKVTGETRYTFEHWIKDNEYMTVVDRPRYNFYVKETFRSRT